MKLKLDLGNIPGLTFKKATLKSFVPGKFAI